MPPPLRAALLLLLSTTAACSTVAAPARSAEAGEQMALHPGEEARIGSGGTLRYLRLVNDSRCAPDVQCIWAGDAEIALEWRPTSGDARALSLHTHLEPKAVDVEHHRISLASLARGAAPEAVLRIEPVP